MLVESFPSPLLQHSIRGPYHRPQVSASLHVILLQLGQYVFPVGIFAQGGDVWSNLNTEKKYDQQKLISKM